MFQNCYNNLNIKRYHKYSSRLIYLFIGFNGTFTTNRLYRAIVKYVAVKKVKLMRKFTKLRVGNTYNKSL